MIRALTKFTIACFCLWHMSAVGVYALRNAEGLPALPWIKKYERIFRPYVLTASQWQMWNLFSPDPIRKVVNAQIEIQEYGTWKTVDNISWNTLEPERRAQELKILRRMDDPEKLPLRNAYLREYCQRMQLPAETRIRFVWEWYLIPDHSSPQSIEYWHQWSPHVQYTIDPDIPCSPTS